jgi:rhodanese-related sulfurtransferase
MTTASAATAPAPSPGDAQDGVASARLAPGQILDLARTRYEATQGAYAGAVTPPEAWHLFTTGAAKIVDVRTAAEVRYVGCVPGAAHVEWHGRDPEQVERFLEALRAEAARDEPLLFLCRSAVRSHHAAAVARSVGYGHAFNVLEGFEGQRNHAQQRGQIDGWRRHGLPWIQD